MLIKQRTVLLSGVVRSVRQTVLSQKNVRFSGNRRQNYEHQTGRVKISELQSVKGKFSLAGKKAIVTGGAGGFFLAVLVTCLIGLPTMVISCWRTKEGPRLRAAEHPVCRHVSRDVLDSGAERWFPFLILSLERIPGTALFRGF